MKLETLTPGTASAYLRWIAVGIFDLSSALNYLDRQLLAAVAPTLKAEFHLNNAEYGQILSVFSTVYALVAPFAGWFVDWAGLTLGTIIAVSVWSLAGSLTAATRSFGGLLACRTVLGAAEAAGIPSTGKAHGTYLQPHELAFGTAFAQIGNSLGLILAPLLVAAIAPAYGWRAVFVIAGALGFIWVPVWWFTSRRVPGRPQQKAAPVAGMREVLGHRALWGLVIGNALVMTVYTLWTNWTTIYFVTALHLTQNEANQRFVWIPSIFAVVGGFAGGAMAFHWIRRGMGVIAARLRVCWISAAALLLTAIVPLMPAPGWAAAAIGLSFFWSVALTANTYVLPIDVWGSARAAFGVGALTLGYGAMQTITSPLVGSIVDRYGFTPVCAGISMLPLLGVLILHLTLPRETP
jgi:ACS family hexuronate transporter-like MFS transporter